MYKLTIHKKDGMDDTFSFDGLVEIAEFLNKYVIETMLEKNYMELEFTLTEC